MNSVIELTLSLLQAILPQLGVSTNAVLIERIIEGLIALIPVLVKEYQDLLPMIKNVINALKSNASVTPDQLESLQKAEIDIDAAFEAAATKAEAEDNA